MSIFSHVQRSTALVPRTGVVGLDHLRAVGSASMTISLDELFAKSLINAEIPRPQNYDMMERRYGTSAWVYVCVRRKARDLSSAPLKVFRRNRDDTDVELRAHEHPLSSLLHRVNPWMTMPQLVRYTSMYLDLTGNAFWLVFRDAKGVPIELYPVNPMAVRIFPGVNGPVGKYEVWQDGQPLTFLPWLRDPVNGRVLQRGTLLHFRLENPTSDRMSALPSQWGVGPLEAGWALVITDEDAVRWNRNLVKNDGRPTGVLTSDLDINEVQAQAAAERYRATFGGPNNVGKILVLGKNLKYQRMAFTPKETDYTKSRVQLREEIMAVFGMNSAVLGLAQGDVGRRQESIKEYWQGTIVATSDSDVLPPINEFMASEFGDDIEVRQDWSKVRALQENEEQRANIAKVFFSMGVPFNTINERFELGFDQVPGGEVGWLPLSLESVERKLEEPEPVPPQLLQPGQPPAPGQQPPPPRRREPAVEGELPEAPRRAPRPLPEGTRMQLVQRLHDEQLAELSEAIFSEQARRAELAALGAEDE